MISTFQAGISVVSPAAVNWKVKIPGSTTPDATELHHPEQDILDIRFAKRDLGQSIMIFRGSPHMSSALAGLSDKTKPSDIA